MGCCISRQTGPNSPYPGVTGSSSSARAINASSPAHQAAHHRDRDHPPPPASRRVSRVGPSARQHSNHSHSHGHAHGHVHGQPLAQHINKPLRRHEWTSRGNRLWTRAALDRERAEFFDTRVTGRQEVWQTLRAALEVLWAADVEQRAARERDGDIDEDGSGSGDGGSDTEGPAPSGGEGDARLPRSPAAVALATAQSILTAADITLPTGDLAQGAYDALGNYYPIPEPVVSDPLNMSGLPAAANRAREDGKGDLTAGEETELDEEGQAARRREEKGKAVVRERDQILVRARLSDGSQDVDVAIGKGDNVRSLARALAEETDLPSNKKIRIAYMGKILKESAPLVAQGWKQGHIVNALVFNR